MAPINSALHLNLALAKKRHTHTQGTAAAVTTEEGTGNREPVAKRRVGEDLRLSQDAGLVVMRQDKRKQKHLSELAALSPETQRQKGKGNSIFSAVQMRIPLMQSVCLPETL